MAIITIRRPNLTQEERAKRIDTIKQATVDLVLAAEKNREGKQS